MPPTASLVDNVNYDVFAQDTLKLLEAQFFAALEDEEGNALAHFHTSWSQFLAQLDTIYLDLKQSTKHDIEDFTAIMVTVSESLMDSSASDALERFRVNLQENLAASNQSGACVLLSRSNIIGS